MSYTLDEIHKIIKNLEAELDEARKRLPALSVKPPIMHQIFTLEDELDELEQLYKLLEANKKA